MRVNGVPFDQGRHPQGRLAPSAVVLHRTYGARGKDTYRGAYSIGKNGRGDIGIGFHFLIGKNEGQWVQFYDTTTKTAHARGANGWAIGIELDGVNEDELTDWQVRATAWIIAQVAPAHGLELSYYDGPRKQVRNFLPHSSVPGSDHYDRVTRRDWDRIVALIQAPPTAADFRRMEAGLMLQPIRELPVLSGGQTGLHVAALQRALNVASGAGLTVDGQYGPATAQAVKNLQRVFGFPEDGIAGDKVRFILAVLLDNIAAGRA